MTLASKLTLKGSLQMGPILPAHYGGGMPPTNAEPLGQFLRPNAAGVKATDSLNMGGGKFGAVRPLASPGSSIAVLIPHIRFGRAPSEIAKLVMGWNVILMTGLPSFWTRAYEAFQYEPMNVSGAKFTPPTKSDTHVPPLVWAEEKHVRLAMLQGPNPTEVRNLIAGKVSDVAPFFCESGRMFLHLKSPTQIWGATPPAVSAARGLLYA